MPGIASCMLARDYVFYLLIILGHSAPEQRGLSQTVLGHGWELVQPGSHSQEQPGCSWLGLAEPPVWPHCKGTLSGVSPFLLPHGLSVHVCSSPASCFSVRPWTHLVSDWCSLLQWSSLPLNCPGLGCPYPSALLVGPSCPSHHAINTSSHHQRKSWLSGGIRP